MDALSSTLVSYIERFPSISAFSAFKANNIAKIAPNAGAER
jgi:hypothetical protein